MCSCDVLCHFLLRPRWLTLPYCAKRISTMKQVKQMCTDHSQPSSAVLCNKTKHMSLQPFTISRWYGDTHRYTTQLKFKYARDLLLKAIQPFGATTGFHVEQLSLTLLRCYSKIYKVSPGLKPVASTFLTADSLFSPQLLHSALVDKKTFFPFFSS